MSRSAVEFRPATPADAHDLAPRLRALDAAEVRAAGSEPLPALISAIEQSLDARAAVHAGRVVMLFGYSAPDPFGDVASPWALGSPEVVRLLPSHSRFARDYLRQVRRLYPSLVNFVDARNKPAIRWLRHIGFEIAEAAPFGPLGSPFHKFEAGDVLA